MSSAMPGLPRLRLSCATRSDIGRVRARNEDVLAVNPLHGWMVLSDGMGGYRGGAVAAQIAVDVLSRRLDEASDLLAGTGDLRIVLQGAIEEANEQILHTGAERAELYGMGATVVAVALLGEAMVCAHVGDSRCYRLSAGALERLTSDHTLLQEQVRAGLISAEEARVSRYRGLLTRGLGIEPGVQTEVAVHRAGAGDRWLLCSDGLTDMLDDATIAAVLAEDDALDALAGRLVDLANAAGGRDNVSVILAEVVAE